MQGIVQLEPSTPLPDHDILNDANSINDALRIMCNHGLEIFLATPYVSGASIYVIL